MGSRAERVDIAFSFQHSIAQTQRRHWLERLNRSQAGIIFPPNYCIYIFTIRGEVSVCAAVSDTRHSQAWLSWICQEIYLRSEIVWYIILWIFTDIILHETMNSWSAHQFLFKFWAVGRQILFWQRQPCCFLLVPRPRWLLLLVASCLLCRHVCICLVPTF